MANVRRLSSYLSLCMLLVMAACTPDKPHTVETRMPEVIAIDTVPVDTFPIFVAEEIPERERDSLYDEYFDDFLFTFSHDSLYRRRRVRFPYTQISVGGDTTTVQAKEWNTDFSFMAQDFYTVMYNSLSEMDECRSGLADTVVVERIDLDSLQLTAYHFAKRKGRWKMFQQRSVYMQGSPLSDFLVFYRQFSTDSLFQQSSIMQPLHISMPDAEDGMEMIEGTIDASQWFSFCPEVPRGTISNILYGQVFDAPQRIVLQKCGQGNGYMEIFTFEKNDGHWQLTSYEN